MTKFSQQTDTAFAKTLLGWMSVETNGDAVTRVSFVKRAPRNSKTKMSPLQQKVFQQLAEYFDGKRKTFDIPLSLQGTEFMQTVWKELQKIPYGETRAYKQIAQRIKNPNACRAVGMANNHNPISIIIPCHRVIGANGELVGYASGLEIKRKLLELEKR
jgi:methylated-DNA-[protein]-cysteine S-methyltransferase